MQRQLEEYEERSKQVTNKIRIIETDNDKILNKSNIIGELTKRSLPYKFAETLLKSEGSMLKKQDKIYVSFLIELG